MDTVGYPLLLLLLSNRYGRTTIFTLVLVEWIWLDIHFYFYFVQTNMFGQQFILCIWSNGYSQITVFTFNLPSVQCISLNSCSGVDFE